MTDTARQAWRQWWDEEGSAMRPLPNEDTEQFARRMTEIAWSNGAFKRLADVEYLCLKRVGLERELAAANAELAAMQKQRDEARELNKEWQQKAATWLATPEAVARLQSYRDLGQQAAKAQNDLDACRAELAAAKKQRDEARREAMQWWRERFSTKEFKEEVSKRGWEYLLVEGGGA